MSLTLPWNYQPCSCFDHALIVSGSASGGRRGVSAGRRNTGATCRTTVRKAVGSAAEDDDKEGEALQDGSSVDRSDA